MGQPQIDQLVERIAERCAGRDRIQLMEICGTHTVSLFRSGVKSLMPTLPSWL